MISKENGFSLPFKFNLRINFQYLFAAVSLLIFLLIIYSNSFYGDWHFDDFFNIVSNPHIQINDFSWNSIKRCIYGLEQKNLSRPLSYFSFSVNYFFSGINVFSYHLVNFIIHYLAAGFLFLFIHDTLKLPLLRGNYEKVAYPLALLSAFFWAINPVHVTSVTYIVQRMASMAGLFYIMSMFFYLKARTAATERLSVVFFILCGLSGLASVFSKENAVMLTVSIFIYDLFLIAGFSKENIKKYLKFAAFPVLFIVVAGFLYTDFTAILKDYEGRDFTMGERLLTEPRVLIFYLSLLFYPINSRLALLYDTDISHSLLQPWTTMPAILIIFLLIGFAFYLAKKRPLISFCVIFYFLNHLIEGSIFSLELIYEHRNYLPSMLLFIPVAEFLIYAIDYFSYKKIMQTITAAVIILILIGAGDNTYLRNQIFSDDFLLWTDNIDKAPRLSRPHANLGRIYATNNDNEKALFEYEKAMALNNFGGIYARAIQEHNLGLLKFVEGKYDVSFSYLERSKIVLPYYIPNIIYTAKIHLVKNDFASARNVIESAFQKYNYRSDLIETYCLILLNEKKIPDAEKYAKHLLKSNLSATFPLTVLAQTARHKGNLQSAISFWRLYQNSFPGNCSANLALIELYAATNDQVMLKTELARLRCLQGNKSLLNYIDENFSKPNLSVYFPDYNFIRGINNNHRF